MLPPTAINPHRQPQINRSPPRQQVSLPLNIQTRAPQRGHSRQQHQHIFNYRGIAMSPAHLHQALVIVTAMRLCQIFSAPRAFKQRQGCISHERRKHQNWKPEWPITLLPTPYAECRCEKTERNRPRIPHKHFGRMKIMVKKTQCRRADGKIHHRKGFIAINQTGDSVEAEAE